MTLAATGSDGTHSDNHKRTRIIASVAAAVAFIALGVIAIVGGLKMYAKIKQNRLNRVQGMGRIGLNLYEMYPGASEL